MKSIKASYTAAESYPLKVARHPDLNKAVESGRIIPLHVQFNPTNRCNLNCPFCSCKNRDQNEELDIELAMRIIDDFAELGCRATTITGGGEPLMYPYIEKLIKYFFHKGIEIGLVTNGLLLNNFSNEFLNMLTWCRISHADYRKFPYPAILSQNVLEADVDWAFSYVVSEHPNYENIMRVVDFVNEHPSFTHIRIVSDLLNIENVPMDDVEFAIEAADIDQSKIIYQTRKNYLPGGDCYICYLKPVVGPDARLYACCGAQYALPEPSGDYPPELCIGEAVDIKEIIERSNIPFDGRVCVKCYYSQYNELLKVMLDGIEHKEFV